MSQSLLKQFGSAMDDVIGNKPDSALSIALMETSASLIEDLRESLISSGAVASRQLLQSIAPLPVELDNGVFTISIEMDSYWKFINEGVNGTERDRGAPTWGKTPSVGMSFKESIREWMTFKGITSLSWTDKDGNAVVKELSTEQDRDGAAFVIMRGLKKNGQKATYFVDNVLDNDYITEIEDKIYKAWQSQ